MPEQKRTVKGYDAGLEFALRFIRDRMEHSTETWREAVRHGTPESRETVFGALDDEAWLGACEVFSWLQGISDDIDYEEVES